MPANGRAGAIFFTPIFFLNPIFFLHPPIFFNVFITDKRRNQMTVFERAFGDEFYALGKTRRGLISGGASLRRGKSSCDSIVSILERVVVAVWMTK